MQFSSLKSDSDQLDKVAMQLAALGGLVEHQLASAITAFEKRDVALAREVVDGDEEVDRREGELDSFVIELLEGRRLNRDQLRYAVTAMKVANMLERIADLSKNIAKRSLITSREDTAGTVTSVVRVGRIALRQLRDVLDALQYGKPDVALAVWGGDQELDELFNSIFREIMTTMSQDPSRVNAGVHLAFVAKNFERIGDHATNIAERVYYSLTGDLLDRQRPQNDITSITVVQAAEAE